MKDDESKLGAIKEQERVVAKFEAIWLEKKAETKDAKDDLNKATTDLRLLIREELPF